MSLFDNIVGGVTEAFTKHSAEDVKNFYNQWDNETVENRHKYLYTSENRFNIKILLCYLAQTGDTNFNLVPFCKDNGFSTGSFKKFLDYPETREGAFKIIEKLT
jgi:hypothetical protein